MGLRPASQVPPWFVVQNPVLSSSLPFGFSSRCSVSTLASCAPFSGVEFSGTRRDVALDEIAMRVGPRVPAYDQSQKDFRIAFILVTQRGQSPRAASLQTLETLRAEWPRFFQQAVEGRGTVNADLLSTSISELRTTIAPDGSRRIESTGLPEFTQVGYATLESAAGISVLRSLAGSNVRSEAALPAAAIGNSFTIYVERGGLTSTGLAIINTATVEASVTLTLSGGNAQTAFAIPARNQKTQFIHELLPGMPSPFTGTATLQSNVPVGLLALRGIVNESGDFIMTTIPVSSGSLPTGTTIFPQIADGGGYVTEILMINPTSSTLSGRLEFSFEVTTDRGRNTRFSYDIAPGEAWKLRTAGASLPEQSGFATLVPDAGGAPLSTLVLRQYSGSKLKFAAGVPGARALSRGVMPGVSDAFRQTAFALVNESDTPSEVRLRVFNADGSLVTSDIFTIAAGGHRAAFLEQLAPFLPAVFEGAVTIEASVPVHVISLRALVNADGEFLMTSMPVIDQNEPPASVSYFPQLVDGGNFTTEFLMLNPNTSAARLQFFDTSGQPLSIKLQ
jgi:hypothetical protein